MTPMGEAGKKMEVDIDGDTVVCFACVALLFVYI